MTYINRVRKKYIMLLCMTLIVPLSLYARGKHRNENAHLLLAQNEPRPADQTGPTQPIGYVVSEQLSTPGITKPTENTNVKNSSEQPAATTTEQPTQSELPMQENKAELTATEPQASAPLASATAPTVEVPHAETLSNKNGSSPKPQGQFLASPKKQSLQDASSALPLDLQSKTQSLDADAQARTALKAIKKSAEAEDASAGENNIEFNFENADLLNLVTQIEEIFNISFIPDDIIDPLKQGRKALKGNKISFKTNKPLNKRQAWSLFITFLNLAGLTITPYPDDPSMYFITVIKSAYTMPTPTYIGVEYAKLPTTDQMIRYVYFVENMTTETLKKIVDSLKSSDAIALELKSNKALLLVDKAYNVRELLKIIKELDQASMPQAMSVMKLRYADAKQVEELYKTLTQTGESPSPFLGPRKQPTSLYFPENTRIIAETRTNALILLGEKDAIQKMEDFISQYIDVDLEQPYAKLHTYQVRHADASVIANIMNSVTAFGKDVEIGKVGGVRGQDKYLRPMLFVAEPATNRVIVRGHYEDYLRAKEVMDQLDAPQPQVGIEVLILTVSLAQIRQLGTQLRSKQPGVSGLLGNNVKFQSAMLAPVVQNNTLTSSNPGFGVDRLLGNLVNIAQGAAVGNTFVTFGQDVVNGALSVWGIFKALQEVMDLTVVSNPFLVTTNKTPAMVAVGQQRRLPTSQIVGPNTGPTPTFDNSQAFLKINIVPQINSDGMIVLDITVEINDFTNPQNDNPTDPANGEQTFKKVKSVVVVANKEVLALGGLVRTTYGTTTRKTPLLGDIPLLGWLFKSKNKRTDKESLLVLISTQIIDAHKPDDIADFTAERMADYSTAMAASANKPDKRDPVNRWFFDPLDKGDPLVTSFLEEQNSTKATEAMEKRASRRQKRNREKAQLATAASPKQKQDSMAQIAATKSTPSAPQKIENPAARPAPQQPTTPKTERFSDILAHKVPPYDLDKDLMGRIKSKNRTSLSLNNFLPTQKGRSV